MKTRKLDFEWERRARQVIAHGALTNSKRPESFVRGVYPTHLKRGFGCRVVDTNENEYIDFICGLGSNLLGYGQEEIVSAMHLQARKGTSLSFGTDLEVLVCEKLKELFAHLDLMRLLKTGSEATTAACIIARAYTGRSDILSEGYHAWHPEFTFLTPPAHGCTRQDFIHKLTSLDQITEPSLIKYAAVIIEPVITDYSKERIEWLKDLRKRCTETGTLLIFDEIITGFRVPGYSIAQETGVIPDLTCLGKSVGGGMPLSVVGGKREVMEADYFVSSTFAGETLSLAAALKFLELLQSQKFKLEYFCQKATQFQDDFNKLSPEIIRLEGYGTRSKLVGNPIDKALFMQEAAKAYLLVGPSFFLCFPHLDILDQILSGFSDILQKLKHGSVNLEGEMPQAPYAQKARET